MFCVGSVFLSLEVFELPYLIALLGGQLYAIVVATQQVVHAPEPGRTGWRSPHETFVSPRAWGHQLSEGRLHPGFHASRRCGSPRRRDDQASWQPD